MTFLENLALGFDVALSLRNVALCFVGVLLGTAIGVLPGIGPLATIAVLLPLTYSLEPVSALIMLAGIYYGAQYGGSTTAILVNLPGESGSIVTCLDGHAMARKGRAGSALAIAALGSFFAGTFGTVLIAGFAPVLSEVALSFGPTEYFSLMVLGLVAAVVLAQGGLIKAVGMVLLGIALGSVGTGGRLPLTATSIEKGMKDENRSPEIVGRTRHRRRGSARQPCGSASSELFHEADQDHRALRAGRAG